jgi:hypothetical protein
MRLCLVLTLAIAVAPSTVAQVKEHPPKQTRYEELDEAGVSSMSEARDLATVIVHVRTQSSRVVAAESSSGRVDARTEHRSVIVDVYKNNSAHPLRVGDEVPILQFAGTYEGPEYRRVLGDAEPFQIGDDLVLFLRWNAVFGAYEAWSQLQFRVAGQRVVPLNDSVIGENRRGLRLEQLANELRDRGNCASQRLRNVRFATPVFCHTLDKPTVSTTVKKYIRTFSRSEHRNATGSNAPHESSAQPVSGCSAPRT